MDYYDGERYGPTFKCELYDYEIDSFETKSRRVSMKVGKNGRLI